MSKIPHLTDHKSGQKYQRAVPLDLQPLLGKKVITRYIGAKAPRDAKSLVNQYAAADDQQFAALRRATPEERALLIQAGGLERLRAQAQHLEATYRAMKAGAEAAASGRFNLAEIARVSGDPEADVARGLLNMQIRTRTVLAPRVEAVRGVLAKAGEPSDVYMGLVDLWTKVRQPRHARTPERYKMYFTHLRRAIGDVDPLQLTQWHLAKFRDYLETLDGVSENAQIKYLDAVRAVFSVAVSEGKMLVNPAKGVQVRRTKGKFIDRVKRKPFTGTQVKTILAKAKETRWSGDNASAGDVLWALRLAAYHGMRIGEVCQLRKEDVRLEHGVQILDIHDAHGHVKNAASVRKIPLHPKCTGFMAYAKRAPGPWVFGFTDYKEGGRAGWIVRNFPKFRREVCGIPDDAKVTQHSFRHRFIDACRDAGVLEDRRHAIVGHAEKGAHGKYGDGPGLKVLAAEMAKVNPLGA